jgi:phospholipase A1
VLLSEATKHRLSRPAALVALVAALGGGLAAAPDDHDAGQAKKLSYFTQIWQLDKEARVGRPSVTFHRSNYALVFSYNTSPNQAPFQELTPPKTLTKPEVTFQLSFKAKIWQDVLGKDIDLWIAYTQRSFWQLYNFDDSSPFRETDYEPEAILNFRTHFSLFGMAVRFIQAGINHQSNGQSEPLSRSWNRLVASVGVERGPLSVLVAGWYRLPESAAEDDNPGITDYVGYGEVRAFYFLKRHRLGLRFRDNLNFRHNRGAIELDWSFPLFAQLGGYVQYCLGYGESLLDYNHRVNRIGVGFIFIDWD